MIFEETGRSGRTLKVPVVCGQQAWKGKGVMTSAMVHVILMAKSSWCETTMDGRFFTIQLP